MNAAEALRALASKLSPRARELLLAALARSQGREYIEAGEELRVARLIVPEVQP